MNIQRSFFIEHGMSTKLDKKTIRCLLESCWINHAKLGALEDEEKYIDECVEFQKKQFELRTEW